MNTKACEYDVIFHTLEKERAKERYGGGGMNRLANKQKKEHKGSFLSGVVILSLSTVLVKVIGLACKIPMIAILGAEGMGYFNSAYEIYALLCVISTAGLPVALAILLSSAYERGEYAKAERIYRSALRMFCILGVVGTLLLIAFAKPIALAIGNADAGECIVAIAPALLCVCLASAVRGYFQGGSRMGPTAVSQLIEAVGKLLFGVLFASLAVRYGCDVSVAAAYGILGLTLGTLLSALYLMILKGIEGKKRLKHAQLGGQGTVRTLLRIAFPITVSAAVLGVTRMVDMALILRRLSAGGLLAADANRIYGAYTTLAIPVFSLIPALITPIALSLVPQLSAAIASRADTGQTRVVTDAVRLTVLLAMPASLGITVYAEPILSLLFSGEAEAIAIAAPLLSVLGISVFFSCMITTTNAILQSYRKTEKPIVSTVTGSLVKIVGAYCLIGIPRIGVYGAPISTFLCNLTVTAMNLWYLHGCLPHTRALSVARIFGKPFAISVCSILLSVGVYLPMCVWGYHKTASFLIAAAVAVVAYVALALGFRVITREDLSLLPWGKKKKNDCASDCSEMKS